MVLELLVGLGRGVEHLDTLGQLACECLPLPMSALEGLSARWSSVRDEYWRGDRRASPQAFSLACGTQS